MGRRENNREITIGDLYVGKSDGLSEASDIKFETLFYKGNNKYRELVCDKDKFIISGRKGSGKTILAKYFELEQNKKKHPTAILTERDAKLIQFMENGKKINIKEEMGVFIEYVIYSEIAILMIRHPFLVAWGGGKILSLPLRLSSYFRMKKMVKGRFYNDNYGIDNIEIQTNKSYTRSNDLGFTNNTIAMSGANTNVSGVNITKRYVKNQYYDILGTLKKQVEFLLKYFTVNIIFDDLDEYDAIITGNEEFAVFFDNFIRIAKIINARFKEINSDNSRVIIILRTDMLPTLNNYSTNLGKTISDSQIRLDWYRDKTSGCMHPLMDMICHKIKNSSPMFETYSHEEIYKLFFPEKIDGIKTSTYILNATFGKPRDVVNMLNSARDNNPKALKFSKIIFRESRFSYSNKCDSEIRNELKVHFSADLINDIFYIIRKIGKVEFWLSDIEAVIQGDNGKFVKEIKEAREFYEICYEYGIIGNTWYKNPSRKKGKAFSWRFREDGELLADPEKKFCLHISLWELYVKKVSK